jgi:hypothetical protein
MMSDWKRATKEISFEGLPPDMISAIKQHTKRYNLGTNLEDALMCIQTDSEKGKKGLFGKSETVQTGVIVTSRWLIWAVNGTKMPTTVLSAQLSNVTVQDYSQRPFMKMVPDSGIQVSGVFTDAGESTSAFIGLEENLGGNKFKELVIKAAHDAKK